jgi:hypothetical protein
MQICLPVSLWNIYFLSWEIQVHLITSKCGKVFESVCMIKFVFYFKWMEHQILRATYWYTCTQIRGLHIRLFVNILFFAEVLISMCHSVMVTFLFWIILYLTVPWFNCYHKINVDFSHLRNHTDKVHDTYMYLYVLLYPYFMNIDNDKVDGGRDSTAATCKICCPNLRGTQSIKISM